MAYDNEGPFTLTAGEELLAYRLVKISGATVVYADAGDEAIGRVGGDTVASAADAAVWPLSSGGILRMVGAGAMSAGATVYPADDGKISGTAVGRAVGVLLTEITADGGIGSVAVMPGASILGAGAGGESVEANTAGAGSPNVLIAGESGNVLTNQGATAKNYHTLPTAVAGLSFTFCVQDSDGMRVTAAAGDTIRVGGSVTAVAGYIESTEIGACVRLKAINGTEWVATSVVGTWTPT